MLRDCGTAPFRRSWRRDAGRRCGLAAEMAEGPFQPTWESLKQYKCPEWFRDAKFGIWAHWGPQAVPMVGDWYARKMYIQGDPVYADHLKAFGHPSQFGYKDIIPLWKAEKWDPDRLMALYKKAGARYFVSMGVHHDNFDLWNSKHHRWNAVAMGPQRDVVGDWQKAAKKQGLRFGVSEHLGASFTWFQPSHGADKTGPKAGVPYDGAHPKYQDLYHPPAAKGDTAWYSTNPEWHQEWFARIRDLVDQLPARPAVQRRRRAVWRGGTPPGRPFLQRQYPGSTAANSKPSTPARTCRRSERRVCRRARASRTWNAACWPASIPLPGKPTPRSPTGSTTRTGSIARPTG